MHCPQYTTHFGILLTALVEIYTNPAEIPASIVVAAAAVAGTSGGNYSTHSFLASPLSFGCFTTMPLKYSNLGNFCQGRTTNSNFLA